MGRELKNIMTLYYLIKLDKKIPTDNKKNKARQDRKVHKIMQKAYTIPFYRERFEQEGLTPEDFHSAEDLGKFPITTRADLRSWMDDVFRNHQDQRYSRQAVLPGSRCGSW